MRDNYKHLPAGVPNWDMVNDMLPEKIRVSDMDGILERHDYILFLEWKETGQKISYGQSRLHQALSLAENQTCITIWGDSRKNLVTHVQVSGVHPDPIQSNLSQVRKFIQTWWNTVDSRQHYKTTKKGQ